MKDFLLETIDKRLKVKDIRFLIKDFINQNNKDNNVIMLHI